MFELIGGMPGQSKVKLAALRDALAAREPAILTIGELKQNLTDAELTEVIKSENLGNRLKKQVGRFLSATESGYQWTAAHRGGKRVGGNGNNAVLFKVSDMDLEPVGRKNCSKWPMRFWTDRSERSAKQPSACRLRNIES